MPRTPARSASSTPGQAGRATDGGIELEVGGAEPMTLRCRLVVNSAGLHAPTLARKHRRACQPDRVPTAYYAKGNYFTLTGRSPFSRLIYPVPVPGGLGVHMTIDLGGQARFGPDVEWIEGIDYTVDPHRADSFYAAVRRYWPALQGWRAAAGLCRHPAEDRATRRAGTGFRRAGAADARRRRG